MNLASAIGERVYGALQRLHERAHPDSTLYIEYCREPECREVLEIYGFRAP